MLASRQGRHIDATCVPAEGTGRQGERKRCVVYSYTPQIRKVQLHAQRKTQRYYCSSSKKRTKNHHHGANRVAQEEQPHPPVSTLAKKCKRAPITFDAQKLIGYTNKVFSV